MKKYTLRELMNSKALQDNLNKNNEALLKANEPWQRQFAELREYIKDNYYNIHPKNFEKKKLEQVSYNIGIWIGKLTAELWEYGDTKERDKFICWLREVQGHINATIKRIEDRKKEEEETKVKENIVEENDYTRSKIITIFNEEMNQKDNYSFFEQEEKYNQFINILTRFFKKEQYKKPENPFNLRPKTKTEIARILRTVYDKTTDSNNLKSENEFFSVIRLLNHFKEDDDGKIYKALIR